VQGKGWSDVRTPWGGQLARSGTYRPGVVCRFRPAVDASCTVRVDPHAVIGCAAVMLASTGAAIAHATDVTVPKEGTLVTDGTGGTGENTTAVGWSRSWGP
jgi:hypothetical protein